MTKLYTLEPAAQTPTPHPFSLNRNERKLRVMTPAEHQQNRNWSETVATHYQYTLNESQSKLPSSILLILTPVFTLPKKTKKYRTRLSSCGKNSDYEPSYKQQKTGNILLLMGQDAPIASQFSSCTRLGTKQQKTAYTLLPNELVRLITSPIASPIASRTRSRPTTVPKK